jgi:type IX secretion system PorP/SprF family membrane protein
MKKLAIFLFVIASAKGAFTQQDPMFTHYAFNTLSINPAYSGNRGMLSAALVHRSQWVGFDGAPMSQTLTLSTPVLNDVLGIGFVLGNDRIGPTNIFTGSANIAYKLKINKHSKLSFGMSAGINNYNRNLGALTSFEQNDYAIDNNNITHNIFDIGAGVLYTNKTFYVGASVPRLLNNHFRNSDPTVSHLGSKEKQHLYLTMGTAFKLGKQVECKPSSFVKITEGTYPQLDLTSMFVFNEKFELGAMWRTTDALGVLVGYTINRNVRIGYSFDWSYGLRTFQYNFGSHELMLRYDLFKKEGDNIVSPRYF